MNTTLDLDLLMERIRKIAKEELQAEKATIFLGDEANQELHSAYLEDTNLDINLTFGSGIAGTVAKEGRSIIIDDAQNDARFYKGVDELSGFTTKTILCWLSCAIGMASNFVVVLARSLPLKFTVPSARPRSFPLRFVTVTLAFTVSVRSFISLYHRLTTLPEIDTRTS